jgi:hypothetical protein
MGADGVALCARFSIATNRLQFCGPADAEPDLYAAITRGERLDGARRALERFEALYPYLEAIARVHGRDPFDRDVVEAYWIGNSLLDAFGRDEFGRLLDALGRRGLPRAAVERLRKHLPADPIPHHVFHVAFVGVGEVTGHVETTVRNMEECRPRWATVRAVHDGTLALEGPTLGLANGRLVVGGERRSERPFDPAILPTVRAGSVVALHWDHPALELTPAEATALRSYSARAFAAANEALPDLRSLS